MDASDAKLITEQEIWVAINPYQKNQAFDYANGDVYKWKCHQRILARKFDLKPLPYEGECFRLAEAMKKNGVVCHAIVNENKLLD